MRRNLPPVRSEKQLIAEVGNAGTAANASCPVLNCGPAPIADPRAGCQPPYNGRVPKDAQECTKAPPNRRC